jgi:hypothetical protein
VTVRRTCQCSHEISVFELEHERCDVMRKLNSGEIIGFFCLVQAVIFSAMLVIGLLKHIVFD